MDSLKKQKLLSCWPADSKVGGGDALGEDNFSEGDAKDEKKDKQTKSRAGTWKERSTKDRGKDEQGKGKQESKKAWRQKLAEDRDPWRHYTLQGEAYVHGLMDGEAVSEKFYKQIPEHCFEIR